MQAEWHGNAALTLFVCRLSLRHLDQQCHTVYFFVDLFFASTIGSFKNSKLLLHVTSINGGTDFLVIISIRPLMRWPYKVNSIVNFSLVVLEFSQFLFSASTNQNSLVPKT